MMKSIVCYGDSNTWGYIPGSGNRYPRDIRWTGVMQELLGSEYYVIEEGLNGRTTVWDDPVEVYKNGKKQLIPILQSHKPIDMVVLMLGTNDLKTRYHVPMFDIQLSILQLVSIIQTTGVGPEEKSPELLLIAPPLVQGLTVFKTLFEDAEEKSRQFSASYQEAADLTGCHFLDAASIVEPSPIDGVHLTAEGHKRLAEHIAGTIQQII